MKNKKQNKTKQTNKRKQMLKKTITVRILGNCRNAMIIFTMTGIRHRIDHPVLLCLYKIKKKMIVQQRIFFPRNQVNVPFTKLFIAVSNSIANLQKLSRWWLQHVLNNLNQITKKEDSSGGARKKEQQEDSHRTNVIN